MKIIAKKPIDVAAHRQRTQGRLRSHFVVLWPVTILLIAGTPQIAAGQDLSLIGADGGSIDLAMPSSGFAPLVFHHTATDGPSFDIDLSTFLSEGDQPASVTIGTSGDAEPATALVQRRVKTTGQGGTATNLLCQRRVWYSAQRCRSIQSESDFNHCSKKHVARRMRRGCDLCVQA